MFTVQSRKTGHHRKILCNGTYLVFLLFQNYHLHDFCLVLMGIPCAHQLHLNLLINILHIHLYGNIIYPKELYCVDAGGPNHILNFHDINWSIDLFLCLHFPLMKKYSRYLPLIFFVKNNFTFIKGNFCKQECSSPNFKCLQEQKKCP